ncbi:hypothetical protein [Herminiimonas aquatilis]|uniref:Uncharacterized protein n=1 Tax=Herminiimonas aquatilis TaxID=345342 RepID=A0ABW2J5Y0_9BURK
MSAEQIYLLNGWTVEFQKYIHMHSHSLELSRGSEAYQVFCEDTRYGFVGIWPYELKETVTDAIFHELLAVLRKWASLSDFQYRLYTSQNDYETNDTQA